MDYKSISAGELASVVEVQRSNISHILNGRNKPGAAFIEKMLTSYPDLNARWLMTGDGDMLRDKAEATPVEPTTNKSESASQRSNQLPFEFNPTKSFSKSIDKIVIFFTDGTFVDYRKQ